MVPRERLELSHLRHWLLRPACLPIPPSGRICFILSFCFPLESLCLDSFFKNGGQRGIRTPEVVDKGFTVPPIWPLWNLPEKRKKYKIENTKLPLPIFSTLYFYFLLLYFLFENGATCRIWTDDHPLTRRALYQLS